jgi:hypothetical protein
MQFVIHGGTGHRGEETYLFREIWVTGTFALLRDPELMKEGTVGIAEKLDSISPLSTSLPDE